MKNAIPYYRVSTDRQGQTGLGLEGQQKAVHDFAVSNGFQLLDAHVEIESGRKKQRPVLRDAIQLCKKQNGVLLIAKLDRLSRNVAFISALLESGIDFIAVDNPTANKLMVHIMAAFAEYESDLIRQRTKTALEIAKERGVQLGSYGKNVQSKKNKQKAYEFAVKMEPFITMLRGQGFKTVRALCDQLNLQGVPPYYGTSHKWHVLTVHKVLKRLEENKTS